MQPDTRYARSGDLRIAYQVVGDGPIDLVFVPGFISNIDLVWDDPVFAGFLKRLAGFSRLILFDKRGTGLSDRGGDLPGAEGRLAARAAGSGPRCRGGRRRGGLSGRVGDRPGLEVRMDDMRAVMDAAGSERAALF